MMDIAQPFWSLGLKCASPVYTSGFWGVFVDVFVSFIYFIRFARRASNQRFFELILIIKGRGDSSVDMPLVLLVRF